METEIPDQEQVLHGLIATTLSVVYTPATGGFNKEGKFVARTLSHIILEVRLLDGSKYSIMTEGDFRKYLGVQNMTPGLREKIAATMPRVVEVDDHHSLYNARYLTLTPRQAREWAGRIH